MAESDPERGGRNLVVDVSFRTLGFDSTGYLPFLLASTVVALALASFRNWHVEREKRISGSNEDARVVLSQEFEPSSRPQMFAALSTGVRLAVVDGSDLGTASDAQRRTRELVVELGNVIEAPSTLSAVQDKYLGQPLLHRCALPDLKLEEQPACVGNEIPVVPSFLGDLLIAHRKSPSVRLAAAWVSFFDRALPALLGSRSGLVAPSEDGPARVLFMSFDGFARSWSLTSGGVLQASSELVTSKKRTYDPRGKYFVNSVRLKLPDHSTRDEGRSPDPTCGRVDYAGPGYYIDQEGGGLLKLCCLGLRTPGLRDASAALCVEHSPSLKARVEPHGMRACYVDRIGGDDRWSVDGPCAESFSSLRPSAGSVSDTSITPLCSSKKSDPHSAMVKGAQTCDRENEAVAVLLKRGPKVSRWLVIASPVGRPPYFMVSLVAAAIAAVGLVVGFSRRVVSRTASTSLIRNLQVGVIRVDSEFNVIEANDRAEELVGCRLPTIGAEEGAVPLARYFEARGWHTLEYPKRELREMTLTDVRVERNLGFSSRFFLQKRVGQAGRPETNWLEIYGSPILGTEQSRRGGSFAIVDIPSRERRIQLDNSVGSRRVRVPVDETRVDDAGDPSESGSAS